MITTVLFLLVIILSSVMPQNVDEIMAKYYEAMGGIENLRAWKSMRATAKYILVAQGGTEIPITVWYKAPDKTRIEMSLDSDKAVYVVTSESAWMRDASRGFPEPTLLPEDQARSAMNNADVYPFTDYHKKGHEVEYLGTEKFEGAEVYKVRLIQKTGAESLHLLDVQTGREQKIIIKTWREGKEVIYETIERDFRKVDWLLLPFTTDSLVNETLVRKMVIENVELNPDIDDSLFHFPTKLIKPKILLPNLKRRLHDDEKTFSKISSSPGCDFDGSSRQQFTQDGE
jgi:outer membrane lipoprotein-sorting protein